MNAKAFAQRTKAVAAPIHKSRVRPIRALGPAQDRQRGEIRQLLSRPVPQPKLVVSRAGDRDEQEADRVADRVLRLPEPIGETEAPEEEQEQQVQRREAKEAAMAPGSEAGLGPAAVQRNPASDDNDTEPEEETEEKVQRQATEPDTEKAESESAGDPFEGSAPNELEASANEDGAILQAIIAAYNVIAFFIERIEQIIDLANSIFDSLATIASGKLKAAADYVEKTMAKTLPVIISFLARLIGLGGIADKIRSIIMKIQAKIDKALDRVIGFIKKKAKKLFGKIKTKVKGVLGKRERRRR